MALLSRGPRPLPLVRLLLTLGCTVVLAADGRAQQAPGALEQQVKAAYLLNFTRYVEWPAGAAPAPEAPINLCVPGRGGFAETVRGTVAGRRSLGRPVRVLVPDTPGQAADCHVAFLAGTRGTVRQWLSALRDAPTLTVGEGEEFVRDGGVIAFVIVDETVRFEIDQEAARRAGLRISSRVLALATRIHGEVEPR